MIIWPREFSRKRRMIASGDQVIMRFSPAELGRGPLQSGLVLFKRVRPEIAGFSGRGPRGPLFFTTDILKMLKQDGHLEHLLGSS
jgi:hypothetical protein